VVERANSCEKRIGANGAAMHPLQVDQLRVNAGWSRVHAKQVVREQASLRSTTREALHRSGFKDRFINRQATRCKHCCHKPPASARDRQKKSVEIPTAVAKYAIRASAITTLMPHN
jgi:hypothetical protein